MAFLSMRSRRKLWNYGLTAGLGLAAILIQTTLLSQFPVRVTTVPVYCNLPLTLVILWGVVFGSPLPPITPDELRMSSVGQIFLRQMASGSVAGFLMGFVVAALMAPMLPVFPMYFPLAGWVAGYFCLKHIKQKLLCMPVTFIVTLIAETAMAWQLQFFPMLLGQAGRSGAFDSLMEFAMWEAFLNCTVAPFIYLPLRHWYESTQGRRMPVET